MEGDDKKVAPNSRNEANLEEQALAFGFSSEDIRDVLAKDPNIDLNELLSRLFDKTASVPVKDQLLYL